MTTLYRDLLPALVEAGHTVEVYISRAEYRAGREPLERALPARGTRIVRLPGCSRHAARRWQKLLAALLFAVFG
ncbi:MAG: hypothetical protein GWN54_13230, partial [Gammaproteobacteria bacterium]|nr:hypothetical protein [Gammaproteobacteria bacterium]